MAGLLCLMPLSTLVIGGEPEKVEGKPVPAVGDEPAKGEPAKSEPGKSEPQKSEPAKPAKKAAKKVKPEYDLTELDDAEISPDSKHIVGIVHWGDGSFSGPEYLKQYVAVGTNIVMFDTDTLKVRVLRNGTTMIREGNWVHREAARRVRWVTNSLMTLEYTTEAQLIDINGNYVMPLGQSVIGTFESGDPELPTLVIAKGIEDKSFYYVNVKTKALPKVRLPLKGKVADWVFDDKGVLRAVSMLNSEFWKDATTISNWYWDRASNEWIKLAEFKVTERMWTPEGIAADDKSLIVATNIGRDTRALFSYDVDKRAIGELLVGNPTEDIVAVEGLNLYKFKSAVTNGMKRQTIWFDRDWKIAQNTVDAAIPDRVNIISGNPTKKVLVLSYGDVDAGTWSLLDMEAKTLRRFAMSIPGLDSSEMRPMEITSYAAKDGLTIPAYLTRPANAGVAKAGPVPMVVVIHGGPTQRDYWHWNSEVQFLAKNGYAVFQPQFRGSAGFGKKFEEAGYGQWGLAMQDDITAGVEEMIRRGVADPKRICIYGASYGGYAALWGLVKTPQLYRCGVSFAGVSDIEYMFSDTSDRNDDKVVRELQRAHIGDVRLSREQFDQVSPLKHADRIQAPVFLLHGSDDERVPISHSKKMIDALVANKKPYEWYEFKNEGHGLYAGSNRVLFKEKLLAFLDKYIAPDRPKDPPAETEPVAASAGPATAEKK